MTPEQSWLAATRRATVKTPNTENVSRLLRDETVVTNLGTNECLEGSITGRPVPRVVSGDVMDGTYDAEADSAYLPVSAVLRPGESAETIAVERPAGTLVLDFDRSGRLLGIEIVGARALLQSSALERLDQIA